MERISIGYLRMSAEDFDACTPREVQWRYEAEQGREDREFERIAQLACWVINPWLGPNSRPLKANQLLRRGGGKRKENWWET
jgi:hypothetical protein